MEDRDLTEHAASNDAELAAALKDTCVAPATPTPDVTDRVWKTVQERLQPEAGRSPKRAVPFPAPRSPWRWAVVAASLAAAVLIATLLAFRKDESWEMAARKPADVAVDYSVPAVRARCASPKAASAAKAEQSAEEFRFPTAALEMRVHPEPQRAQDPPDGTARATKPQPVEAPQTIVVPPDVLSKAELGGHWEADLGKDEEKGFVRLHGGTRRVPGPGEGRSFEGRIARDARVGERTPPATNTKTSDPALPGSKTGEDELTLDVGRKPEPAKRNETTEVVSGPPSILVPPLKESPASGAEAATKHEPSKPADTRPAGHLAKPSTGDDFAHAPALGPTILVPTIDPPASGPERGKRDHPNPTTEAPTDLPAVRPTTEEPAGPVASPGASEAEVERLREEVARLREKVGEGETKARPRPSEPTPNPYANLRELKPNVPVLQGGTQDDNADFPRYLDFLRQTYAPEAAKLDLSERVLIEVADIAGYPLSNADVRISHDGKTVYKARTFSNGLALFHPRVAGVDPQAQEFRVEVVPPAGCKGERGTPSVFRGRSGSWQIQVPYARPQDPPKLDILLCLDCTGSMADEIERLQKTLQMMVAKFNALPGKPQTRWGLVQYRDRGDRYVTQLHDFTGDVDKFQKRLDACDAAGGGDEPESVNEALRRAVDEADWDRGDTIRLVFLIGDAPPHMDYQDDVRYPESMQKAQRRAIKIYPLAASGLNKTGEVIFRQLAQYTLARFLFISYGGSTPHEVSRPSQSNNLDDLIVHIVASEVNARAAQRRGPLQFEDPEHWQGWQK